MSDITRNEIKNYLDTGADLLIVDALPEDFYEESHLPGAISMPPGRVTELAPKLVPDKKKLIIVYCSTSICQNSKIAVDELAQMGYVNVFRYVDGKEDWKSAGLPLESGPSGHAAASPEMATA